MKLKYIGDSPVDIPDLGLQVVTGDLVDDPNGILNGRVDFVPISEKSKKGVEN